MSYEGSFAALPTAALAPGFPFPARPRLPRSHSSVTLQCRNIYLLSIDYAFRAGRNLPDKEFRYLRTVIVTAAVYWGLNSKLRLR